MKAKTATPSRRSSWPNTINKAHRDYAERRLFFESLEERRVLAPVLTASFEAFNYDDNPTEVAPPDPHGAAGPNHVVNVGNVSIQWFTKDGTPEVLTSLQDFFSPLQPTTSTFDPKVLYDQFSDRFVVMTLEQLDVTLGDPQDASHMLVAVSDDSDPNGTWYFQAINTQAIIDGLQHWADYPGFAIDEEAIYLTANMFTFGAPVYGGSRLWILDKGAGSGGLYDGGLSSVTVHDPATLSGSADNFTLQPAHIYGTAPTGVGTWLAMYSGLSIGVDELVDLIRVNDPLGTPTFTSQRVNVGDLEDAVLFPTLPDAPQLGTPIQVEVNDRRALDAVWRDDSLWLTAQIMPLSGPDTGETTAHWFRIDTSDLLNPVLAEQGNVGGESIATGTYTFMPSIAVDAAGNMAIGFAASAPSIYPGAYYTVKPAGSASVQPAGTLATGVNFYVRTFGGPENRWGDYSAIVLDPADEATFWVYNEYAITRGVPDAFGEDGRWGTRWGAFRQEPPPPPPPPPVPPPGEIRGTKFNDVDGDGIRDMEEPGIAGFYIYVDLNGNDRIDIGEPAAVTDNKGNYAIQVTDLAQPGQTMLVVREVMHPGWVQTYPGPSQDFEHVVPVIEGEVVPNVDFGNQASDDFGDAPAPYPTLLADNGARSPILPGFHLGVSIDAEGDGQPNSTATGDDIVFLRDEDGVRFLTPLFAGFSDRTVEVTVQTGGYSPGVLNAWIDFNQDGDWKDAGERIISDKRLGDGVHVLTYAIPANAAVGQTYARFRYGYERGIGPGGADLAGEVEDYRVLVLADQPQANDDAFTVDQGSFNNLLDVLANDFPSSAGPLTVIAVGPTDRGGLAQIGPGGGSVIYTPAASFFSPPAETFTYTVRDPAGRTDSATVTVTVLPAFTDPVAVDDMFPTQVIRNSVNNVLDVLANDLEGTEGPIRIISVTQPANGEATIDNRGTPDPSDDVIRYTPDVDFSNLDQFTYTIANSAIPQATSTATVSIQVQPDAPLDDIVDLTFDFTDLSGNLISSITVGSQFRLRASVQDIRTGFPTAPGVFAAYQDILYDFGLVSVVPSSLNPLGFQIQFSSEYSQVQSGDAQVPGIIDEVGAVQTSGAPLGDAKFTVFTITFMANAPGFAEFLGDPADQSPAHDVLLFEPPEAVPLEQIRYDVATISIVGGSAQSALDVNGDGEISPIDALAVINTLNFEGPRPVNGGEGEGESAANAPGMRYDVNGDGMISPIDALAVINYLNAHSAGSGESGSTASPDRGEGESLAAAAAPLLPVGSPMVVSLQATSSTTASDPPMADLVFASLAADIATETTDAPAATTAPTQVVAVEPRVDVGLLEDEGLQDSGMPLDQSQHDQGDHSLLDELAEDVSGVWDAPETDDIILRFLTD